MGLKNNQPLVLQADIEKLKNELRQERDIESLVRHIVLTNRRLFAILVCESPIQAKAAAEVLEKAVAEMEEKAMPFLCFAFKRKAEEPATFQELVPQILEPLFYWDETDTEKKVFLVDASDAQEQDQEGWIILFQRMNEVRNTLMNRLPGPLILILTSALANEFPRRAPDFWSIMSEIAEIQANLKPLEPLEHYKKNMKAQYNKLQIWKMDKPASLEGIYTRVKLLDKPSAFRQAIMEELQKEFQSKTKTDKEKEIDGLEAVQKNQMLFILGKPGAGKTTFLKYVTLKAIDGELNYIPIFISLRSFSESGLTLSDFITNEFERFEFPNAQSFIEAILTEGKAVLLCDGLDEVNKENGLRDDVVKKLTNFYKKYETCKVIITCRTAVHEYQQSKDFAYVEMADFDDQQIKTFVYKWFTDESEIGDRFLKEFEGIRSRQIQELAKNPLLLTLLCISFHETLSFPSRRSEIYEEALDALLRKWDTFRRIKRDEIYRNLSLGRKRQMFARIAYETFEKGEYLFEEKQLAEKVAEYLKYLPQTDTEEKIDGVSVIKAIEAQHGVFIERAEGIYSFAHLTFQEYYTAKYIVTNARKGTLKGLIENHFTDESWQEVFLLTAEMLDDADEFFEIFLKVLDDFVGKDERLIKFLEKVEERAKKATIKAKSLEIKYGVVYIMLRISFALAPALARYLMIALARDLNFTRAPDILIACAPDITRDPDFDRDLALDIAIAMELELARLFLVCVHDSTLAHDLARKLARKLDLDFKNYYNQALEFSKEMGLNELHTVLANLSVPSEDASKEECKIFADSLSDIFRTHRPVKDYEFKEEEANHFGQYLYATKLLIDCLKVAYVSDREAIEDRLLRPPVS